MPSTTAVPPPAKMSEHDATQAVRAGVAAGTPVRQLAQITGWSVGWVSELAKEFRQTPGAAAEEQPPPAQRSGDELEVLQGCVETLSGLDAPARRRILRYLGDLFDGS
ncbi:hypothetical protein ACFCX6_31625 [Streptomyces sp. NPDC056353]|uniref:hypothetical protein n=1 Tax=Streptomyces TaxID=1883 RepID=UPI0035DF508C